MTVPFLGLAAIVPPCELIKIAVNVLGANPVMDTEHLPLELRPRAFQAVDVAEVIPDVLPEGMVDW